MKRPPIFTQFMLVSLVFLVVGVLAACGGTTPGPTPKPPTPPEEPQDADVSGAWALTMTNPSTGATETLDLNLTQVGSNISGLAFVAQSPFASVAGTIKGNDVKLRFQISESIVPDNAYFDLVGVVTDGQFSGVFTTNLASAGTFFAQRAGPPAQVVNVAGEWILTTTNQANNTSLDYYLSLTQHVGQISGTVLLPNAPKEPSHGTVVGSITGSKFSLFLSVTVFENPADPKLELVVAGTATPTELVGTFSVLAQGGATGPVTGRRPGSTTPPPPPPPVPSALAFTIVNTTFTEMQVQIDGRAAVAVRPGDETTATFPSNPGSVRVYATTSGRTTTGEPVGLKMVWDFTQTTTGRSDITRTLVVSPEYFFLNIRNSGSRPLTELKVNYGLQNETIDNISIANSGTLFGVGYYRAFSNTRVQARLGSTSSLVRWDNLSLPFTENQSINLTNQL